MHVPTRRMEKDGKEVQRMLTEVQGITPGSVPDNVSLENAMEAVWNARAGKCPRSANQVRQRLYRAVCLMWPHNVIRRPPKISNTVVAGPPGRSHFTDREVCCLLETARSVGPGARAWLLMEILLTSGCRIGALSGLTWGAVRDNGSSSNGLRRTAIIHEKGNRPHFILLTERSQQALAIEERRCTARLGVPPADNASVWTVRTRQLRNIFYLVCQTAGIRGSHCHPHACRHTVAHCLFLAGNPIALVAKYLGHTNLETTNRYYLRLSFDELVTRLVIPWIH
jgi:hypothetical protein